MTVPENPVVPNDPAVSGNPADRRAAPRARVIWKGSYFAVDTGGPLTWQRCYLVNLSALGAAVEIHGDELTLGQRIVVRLEAHETYGNQWLQLRGTVVNRRGAPDGRVFGVLFAGLVDAQREHLLRITMAAHRNPLRERL